MDSATVALASAVPEIATACSLALTVSSPATTEIDGAVGATVSTLTLRVAAAETLPAASTAVIDSTASPSPMDAMSSGVSP